MKMFSAVCYFKALLAFLRKIFSQKPLNVSNEIVELILDDEKGEFSF